MNNFGSNDSVIDNSQVHEVYTWLLQEKRLRLAKLQGAKLYRLKSRLLQKAKKIVKKKSCRAVVPEKVLCEIVSEKDESKFVPKKRLNEVSLSSVNFHKICSKYLYKNISD